MKTQTHNQGELKELTVNIEADVVESVKVMSQQSSMSVDDIVVIALKRYRTPMLNFLEKLQSVTK